jgi:hypothetical protein
MAFRLCCPKCGSSNINIETDRARGWGNPEPVLHCLCGKMIYGEKAIEALYQEQQAAWKAGARERVAVERAQQEQVAAKERAIRIAAEAHRRQREEQAAAKVAAAEARRLETLRWMEENEARRKAEREARRKSPPAPRGKLAFQCAHCGAVVWKTPYEVKRSKTGKFFCNHDHHQAWFVANGGPSRAGPLGRLQHRLGKKLQLRVVLRPRHGIQPLQVLRVLGESDKETHDGLPPQSLRQ